VSGASLLASCFIRESNADQLLQARAVKLRKSTGDYSLKTQSEHKDANGADKSTISTSINTQLLRPLHFLVTEPLITLCALLCSIAFSLLYAATESLPLIYSLLPFASTFKTEPQLSLPFLALLLGLLLNVLPRIYDAYSIRHSRTLRQRITPETKISSVLLACPLFAIGLWVLAWTIPPSIIIAPWPLSFIGLVCIGFAANDFSYVLFGYVSDSYGADYAASAVGAVSFARTLAAGGFPLFVTQMYEGLGNNVATTVIAAVATVFCVAALILVGYGAKLRERSKYAVKGKDAMKEENWHLDGKGGNAEEMVRIGLDLEREAGPRDSFFGVSSFRGASIAGFRGSTRLSDRSNEGVKPKKSWSENVGDVKWEYTKVEL
jgi:hypothetical protein